MRTDDFGVQRVAAVETEHGTIQTPCVVNCAGGQGSVPALGRPRWLLPKPGPSPGGRPGWDRQARGGSPCSPGWRPRLEPQS